MIRKKEAFKTIASLVTQSSPFCLSFFYLKKKNSLWYFFHIRYNGQKSKYLFLPLSKDRIIQLCNFRHSFSVFAFTILISLLTLRISLTIPSFTWFFHYSFFSRLSNFLSNTIIFYPLLVFLFLIFTPSLPSSPLLSLHHLHHCIKALCDQRLLKCHSCLTKVCAM